MKKFLPTNNSMTTITAANPATTAGNSVLSFGAYYDVTTATWKSVGNQAAFIIQNDDSLIHQNFIIKAAGNYADGQEIEHWNTALSIDQYGAINYAQSEIPYTPITERCGGFIEGVPYTEEPPITSFNLRDEYYGKTLLFNYPVDISLILSEISPGFFCYLQKAFGLLRNEVVKIDVPPGVTVRSGNVTRRPVARPNLLEGIWTSTNSKSPALVSGERILFSFVGEGTDIGGSDTYIISGGLVENYPYDF